MQPSPMTRKLIVPALKEKIIGYKKYSKISLEFGWASMIIYFLIKITQKSKHHL
jgi:hypothetical protein